MSELSKANTGELIDELLHRALVRGEPYIRLYADDLVKQLNEMRESESELWAGLKKGAY